MKQLKKEWTKLMTGETQCNDFTMNKTRSNRIKRYIQSINPNDYLERKIKLQNIIYRGNRQGIKK